MWDACVCYEIAIDEERIVEDGIYSLEKMYAFMDKAFEMNDCRLEKIDGNMRVYVRSVDNKDLQCMWMAVKMFEESEWFETYACRYMFYIYDTENGEIEEEEDWLEECGVYSFSFCLPVKEDIIKDGDVKIDMDRLGWYMDKMTKFGKRKI